MTLADTFLDKSMNIIDIGLTIHSFLNMNFSEKIIFSKFSPSSGYATTRTKYFSLSALEYSREDNYRLFSASMVCFCVTLFDLRSIVYDLFVLFLFRDHFLPWLISSGGFFSSVLIGALLFSKKSQMSFDTTTIFSGAIECFLLSFWIRRTSSINWGRRWPRTCVFTLHITCIRKTLFGARDVDGKYAINSTSFFTSFHKSSHVTAVNLFGQYSLLMLDTFMAFFVPFRYPDMNSHVRVSSGGSRSPPWLLWAPFY